MIKLQVIGNLGKDCVLNQVNGKNVINFSVAHTEKFKDSSGVTKEKTTWVECAYWTDRVGVAPYLKRGSQVYVEGTPEIRHYTKNDGTPGSSLSLRVFSLQLTGGRPDGASNGNHHQEGSYSNDHASQSSGQPESSSTENVHKAVNAGADDLPF